MLQQIQNHPIVKRLLWMLFAVLFYQSGMAFTLWLLNPASFAGAQQWVWLVLFPVFLPAFFLVNRYLGCASGCARDPQEAQADINPVVYPQPPGF